MKKIVCLITCFIFLIFTFLLIVINIMAINFPEWIVILFFALSLIGLLGYLLMFKTKLVTKIILPIFFFVFGLVSTICAYSVPYWNTYSYKKYKGNPLNYDDVLTYKQAKQDIDYMLKYVSDVHPCFQDKTPDEITRRYKESLNRLKSDSSITVNELRKEIQYILNYLRDAHTTTYNSYPNDKYLTKTIEHMADGYSIVEVNGLDALEIRELAKGYYSYEVEEWISVDVGSLASLEYYGFKIDPLSFYWENSNGDSFVEEYTISDFVSFEEYNEEYLKYYPSEAKPFVYYDIYDDYAVLTLKSCRYNDYYIKCVSDFFNEVNAKNIKNVAVDVRNNGGGASTVVNEFIKYLPVDTYFDVKGNARWGMFNFTNNNKTQNKKYQNQYDGNVYVLTNNNSFSSAMDFAQIIQDNNLGKIIGEASANTADGYGDVASFRLPNTGLYLQISTKKWERIDPSKGSIILPDYPCDSEDALEELRNLSK